MLTSMKTPSLIRSIERDLEVGHAAVIQIVSTGEALMERRLAEIPTEEWVDVRVDITPREYVLDYFAHSFPVQLYEPFTDQEGNLCFRPVYRDGQPVESRGGSRPPRPLDREPRFPRSWSREIVRPSAISSESLSAAAVATGAAAAARRAEDSPVRNARRWAPEPSIDEDEFIAGVLSTLPARCTP
ncbi:hypothetical protein AYJ54_24290 [Bradyrhizobium centrolobii]|uniref:Uncharacterized protein n=1 Tax=Bradyrhizobium centrolobii TaxID=1505087 RepID=A0A176YFZ9_9BRAD|nr:hypothetical protein AYJ54_24290 [Bradyrhizobium centrolobii]